LETKKNRRKALATRIMFDDTGVTMTSFYLYGSYRLHLVWM